MTREIHFERWRFNPATLELSNGARTVTLEPRVASLLEYFLANPGEMLSHDQLVEVVWQGRVVSDEAVRRAVSTLRQALPGDDAQHWIKTVPRKGYVSQFPTAQTVRHEPDTNDVVTAGAGNAAPQPPRSARRSVLLALVLVALAAGSVWWLRYQRLPESSAQPLAGAPYTIAVLPFTELGEHDPAGDFAEGLTEELRSMLSRFGAFRVTARSSSQQIRTGQALPAEVGEILGVRFLLEGSVRSDGEQLRISAALVETGTGFQRWADSYDGGPQNLFQVQEDIATSVARALQVVLVHRGDGDTLGHVPASAEAHLEYLEGRQQMTSYVVEDLDQAAQHFRRAIVLDPGYARAYAQLADVMLFRSSDLSWQTSKAAVRAAVARLIDKALELDPGLGEAYAQRSFLHDAGDTAAIEADLRRAIELNPSLSGAYESLAMLLHQTGRPAEAFSMIDQARALDPLWPRHHHMKAYLHLLVGQYQQARALELETLRLQPRHVWALMGLGRIEALQGNFAEGLRYMEQAFSLDPRSDLLRDKLAVAYLSVGESAVTRALSHEANTIADLFLAVFEEDYRELRNLLVDFAGKMKIEDSLGAWMYSDSLLRLALAEDAVDLARKLAVTQYGPDGARRKSGGASEDLVKLNLTLLQYLSGERELALPLIAGLREHLTPAGFPHSGPHVMLSTYGSAIAAAVLGERDTALAALETLFFDGFTWFWWWLVPGHPAFDDLREEPRFQALLASAEAHAERQRALLNEMRRGGSVPDRRRTAAAGMSGNWRD